MAALTAEQFKAIDDAFKVAARQVVGKGRKLYPATYEVGIKDAVTYYTMTEVSAAKLEFKWPTPGTSFDITNLAPTTKPIPTLHKEFDIDYIKAEASRTTQTPLDTQVVASATYRVGQLEDDLLFQGYSANGTNYDINGLYRDAGQNYSTSADFGTATNVVAAVDGAVALMMAQNWEPPYHMALNPTQFTQLGTVFSSTGIPAMDWVKKCGFISDTVMATPDLTDGTGLMVEAGPGWGDIVVSLPLKHIEWTDEMGGIHGYVLERILPRHWDTNAICQLSAI